MSQLSHTVNILSGKKRFFERSKCMHSFARHRHGEDRETKGLILNGGWRYDLTGWFHDIFSFRGQWRKLRQRTITFARLQAGEQILDVGCGTGTLAIEASRLV